MRIEITNLQRRFSINRPALIRLARFFMDRAQRMDASKTWIECSLVIVGHEHMIQINEDVLHHEGTTDVITFAYPASPGESPGWRGEIVINVAEAEEAGARRRGGPGRELALYLAHGCQHLGGADDATTTQRAAMNRRQNRWLRDADSHSLLVDLMK